LWASYSKNTKYENYKKIRCIGVALSMRKGRQTDLPSSFATHFRKAPNEKCAIAS
jgi:hypothetical protein